MGDDTDKSASFELASKIATFTKQMSNCIDDEFDKTELRHREQSRAFFRPAACTTAQALDSRQFPKTNEGSVQRQAQQDTPKRPSLEKSGLSTRGKTIEDTPESATIRRSGRRLSLGGGEVLGSSMANKVTISDSVKSATGFLRRSETKPLPATGVVSRSHDKRLNLLKKMMMGPPIPPSTTRATETVWRSKTMPLPAPKRLLEETGTGNTCPPSKKGKRHSTLIMRPEEEQIFKGKVFYYIPNDDINPVRRLRMAKAREYGATRTQSVSEATHVVVDKHIKYEWAGKMISSMVFKKGPPIVVNENYPIDCTQFKMLLDYNQKMYHLPGHPVGSKTPEPEPLQSSDKSNNSLSLKPPPDNPRRWDYVPPKHTTNRSEESRMSRIADTPRQTDSHLTKTGLKQAITSPETVSSSSEGANVQIVVDAVKRPAIAASGQESVRDELSDMISLMQEYKDLPLEADGEDDTGILNNSESMSESDVDSEAAHKRPQKKRPATSGSESGRKYMQFEDRFACNQAGRKDDFSKNPNMRTIEVLQKMANYYDQVNDSWRTRAYRLAISTLKRQDVKITTEEEAHRLPNVGKRLAEKIEEIVTTDKLQRLKYAEDDPMSKILQLFMGIYGVGNNQAQKWIAQGYRTLDELKQKATLTINQTIGIDHYDDLQTRMPRREVELLGEVVKEQARQVDAHVELIIGGSYRRGAENSGDIDIIITKRQTSSTQALQPFLVNLVHRLEDVNFLVARLASSQGSSNGSKWHGCCVLPKTKGFNEDNYRPVWRRIDFLLVPESEIGAALIYFTGNDIFNRSMRLLARKKGMRLNQHGLYKNVTRGVDGLDGKGELIEGRDERKIFEKLGVNWREPHETWC